MKNVVNNIFSFLFSLFLYDHAYSQGKMPANYKSTRSKKDYLNKIIKRKKCHFVSSELKLKGQEFNHLVDDPQLDLILSLEKKRCQKLVIAAVFGSLPFIPAFIIIALNGIGSEKGFLACIVFTTLAAMIAVPFIIGSDKKRMERDCIIDQFLSKYL